jgi:hypothetical protein
VGICKVWSKEKSFAISQKKPVTISRKELISCQKRNAQKKPCNCKKLNVSKLQVLP